MNTLLLHYKDQPVIAIQEDSFGHQDMAVHCGHVVHGDLT